MMANKGWCVSRGVVLFLSAVLLNSPFAYSAQISNLQYNLFGGDGFSAGNQSLLISENSENATVAGVMLANGDDDYYYEIRGGSIDIRSSQLLQDLSSGGVALGHFASGATLNMTGSIWYNAPGQNAEQIFNGTLLSATVQKDFYVLEDSPDSLSYQLDLGITGGELLSGTHTGLSLEDTHFVADISLYFCSTERQPHISNFSSVNGNISYLSPSGVQMYAAPEPCTISLLGFGLLALRMRKK